MPILSAGAWFVLAFLQVYRDRWHTWTETFFLFACFFAGLYAIGDWLFFGAKSLEAAQLAALISFTGLTLATNFFLLFTLVYVDRMRTWYWAFMIISFGMLIMILIPNVTFSRIVPPQGSGLYVPEFHPIPFGIYLIYTIAYGIAGVRNLYRLYSIVKESSKVVARRALGLMITFTCVLILGLVTNGLLGIIGNTQIPPPFSTLLILVAAVAYYTLYPAGRQRISEAIRLFQARRYSIKAVFLTFQDGTLIGSKVRPGETVVDEDLFGATLDVIQNYTRTSASILRGKSLSAISHGSYTLVMERGRSAYLTVLLEGEEADQLRRQMRDLLLNFEAENRQVLTKWQGVPSDAKGTEEMLTEFFVQSPLV
ncbi:MAG: hypothetical protein E6K14_07660 [Methanobacteriota archaeon]|nr:MAG: hypothetical protein E6K14_07660 [Euryarchaeota archaeon]